MLEVGNGYLTEDENRAHFSLWALLNAPLIAGNDLRDMSPEVRDILTNREVIAVDQDWGGRQGYRVRDEGNTQVWAKPMSDGSVTVILLNPHRGPVNIATTVHEIGLKAAGSYRVRDLWNHTDSLSQAASWRPSAPTRSRCFASGRSRPAVDFCGTLSGMAVVECKSWRVIPTGC